MTYSVIDDKQRIVYVLILVAAMIASFAFGFYMGSLKLDSRSESILGDTTEDRVEQTSESTEEESATEPEKTEESSEKGPSTTELTPASGKQAPAVSLVDAAAEETGDSRQSGATDKNVTKKKA